MDAQTIKLFGSKSSDEWETPQEVLFNLFPEFLFTLDVASSHENRKCSQYFTLQDDALTQPWYHKKLVIDGTTSSFVQEKGRVWCNPPYSKVKQFLHKCHHELQVGTIDYAVFLTFSNTDTSWFHQYCYGTYDYCTVELRFIKGRLKFKGLNKDGISVTNSAMRPSMLIIFRRKP